jgi:hypothetical protein
LPFFATRCFGKGGRRKEEEEEEGLVVVLRAVKLSQI